MNIKEAEKLTGISRRNIRFYEQKGMLHPARNQDNDYRDYSPQDIQRLKLIRALRMVDMPLEEIRDVLNGTATLGQAVAAQEEQLHRKVQEAQTAIRFCRCLGELGNQAEVDEILQEMDREENRKHLFFQWRQDYKKMCKFLQQATFTFVPDGPVTNAREFTQALLDFARETVHQHGAGGSGHCALHRQAPGAVGAGPARRKEAGHEAAALCLDSSGHGFDGGGAGGPQRRGGVPHDPGRSGDGHCLSPGGGGHVVPLHALLLQ